MPIFPLPDVTFFPHTLLPLHVFEARYRAMVIDALERDRRARRGPAAARLRGELRGQAAGVPGGRPGRDRLAASAWRPGATTSCSGAIAGCGFEQEVPSDTLYRLVRAQRLTDAEPTADTAPALVRVRAGCRALLEALARPADMLDTALAEGQTAGRDRRSRGRRGPARRGSAPEPARDARRRRARHSRRRGRRGARERAQGRSPVSVIVRALGALALVVLTAHAGGGRAKLVVARRAHPRPVRAGDGRARPSATASARASAW